MNTTLRKYNTDDDNNNNSTTISCTIIISYKSFSVLKNCLGHSIVINIQYNNIMQL